jgi:hypothetical protein
MAEPTERPRLSSDLESSRWVGEQMEWSWDGGTGGLLPRGFAAYARVLHPAEHDGRAVRWAEVAERAGVALTPGIWFQDLEEPSRDAGWEIGAPFPGEIPDEVLDELMPVLREHTSSMRAWFCLWEGWGFLHGGMSTFIARRAGTGTATEGRATAFDARPAIDAATADASRLPWRDDYLLFEGPLTGIGAVGAQVISDPVDGDGIQDQPMVSFETHTPSLFWPADRAWCAANDIEASFTCIGGSARLIDALYATESLEVVPVA